MLPPNRPQPLKPAAAQQAAAAKAAAAQQAAAAKAAAAQQAAAAKAAAARQAAAAKAAAAQQAAAAKAAAVQQAAAAKAVAAQQAAAAKAAAAAAKISSKQGVAKSANKPTITPSVLDMTRDGSQAPVQAGARYPWLDFLRWIVATGIVVLAIVFVVKWLKKKGIGVGTSNDAAMVVSKNPFQVKNPIPTKDAPSPLVPGALGDVLAASLASGKMGGNLEVVGAQHLDGSGNMLFLVRAGERMMLLNSNPNTGVRPVSEWDADIDEETDEPPAAFSSYMSSANGGGLRLSRSVDDEAAESVRTRLAQTATRLARIANGAARELD